MLPTVNLSTGSAHAPALSPPAPRRALYLVGEAERSAARPATTVGRTMVSINGRWHALRGQAATYEQLLRIAYPDRDRGDAVSATVSHRRSGGGSRPGLLAPGDVIELEDGLLFNVNATFAS